MLNIIIPHNPLIWLQSLPFYYLEFYNMWFSLIGDLTNDLTYDKT
jgi:hypothetical protein